MADWLSFWNQERRAYNADLAGGAVTRIFVPYGRGKIGRRDRIYCVGIEDGRLLLITRVRAALLEDATEDDEIEMEWIYIDASDDEHVDVDFSRTVPSRALSALTLMYADGSEHPIRRDKTGQVQGSAYEGRSSIRRLVAGAPELDALLD